MFPKSINTQIINLYLLGEVYTWITKNGKKNNFIHTPLIVKKISKISHFQNCHLNKSKVQGVLMVLKGTKTKKFIRSTSGGYLFCNYCGGYYKLKNDESPRDFVKCECGNPLEFCKTHQDLQLKSYNRNRNIEAFDSFYDRLSERRESLKSFLPKIEIGDDFIDDMFEEGELWDVIDLEVNLTRQKNYLNIILEEERLMAVIGEKKARVNNPGGLDKIIRFYEETDPLILLGAVILILIVILVLVVFLG